MNGLNFFLKKYDNFKIKYIVPWREKWYSLTNIRWNLVKKTIKKNQPKSTSISMINMWSC